MTTKNYVVSTLLRRQLNYDEIETIHHVEKVSSISSLKAKWKSIQSEPLKNEINNNGFVVSSQVSIEI